MASKKQIAWRKKFVKMAKSGKFQKSKKTVIKKVGSKSKIETVENRLREARLEIDRLKKELYDSGARKDSY